MSVRKFEKVKAKEIVPFDDFVTNAILKVHPVPTEQVGEIQNLNRDAIEKEVFESITEKFISGVSEALLSGRSVEFGRDFLIQPYESKASITPDETPEIKVRIVLRKAFQEKLNN